MLRQNSFQTDDDRGDPAAESLRAAGNARILIVDDDESISTLFSSALEGAGYDVYTAGTGSESLELLDRATFDATLIDLQLPDMDGFELMRRIHERTPGAPVIMITGHGDSKMARKAVVAGACDFVTKPCRINDLPIIVERNLARHRLAQDLSLSHIRALHDSYESVLDALLSALDTRDTETQGHSERVTAYTMLLADQMGVPAADLYHIERGALLHDIGKIGVPDRILLKPGPLTEDEWVEMKKHPVIGYRMCTKIDFLRGAAQIVLHHHERWDGEGYPDGLMGEFIPLGARIFAVADTLDAMTTDRPYRKALPYADAVREIVRMSGTQFDPDVVEAFLAMPESRWLQVQEMSLTVRKASA